MGGFTLIELMVTIGIAAILAGVAAPSLREVIANNRLKSHSSALQTSLMLARSEAINRKARVVVCKSADQAACASAGNWQQGWIVFIDANDSASVDAGETVIQKVGTLSGSFILQAGGNVTDYVSYTSTGAAKLKASDSFQTGSFNLCQTAGGNARQIELFATGRLSFGKQSVSTCTAS
ncbi:GspH/FimT family pseudopilin [Ramlibacter tataouinensis]|nr:GspH/FimT family pseudopilin [Ramlibacter tataouinensis]